MDIKEIDDDQLDEHRREVLREQERRQKLADGLNRIGATIRDYLDAAGIECPDKTDEELGETAVDAVKTVD